MSRRPKDKYLTTKQPDAAHSKHLAAPPGSVQNLRNALEDWIKDLEQWGQTVRDDIVRLEAATGIALGDPGDPPPPPWE